MKYDSSQRNAIYQSNLFKTEENWIKYLSNNYIHQEYHIKSKIQNQNQNPTQHHLSNFTSNYVI